MKWIELIWALLERFGKTRAVVYNLKVSSDQTIVER
jgi:hypothetical protein